jgi:hypothetical protein
MLLQKAEPNGWLNIPLQVGLVLIMLGMLLLALPPAIYRQLEMLVFGPILKLHLWRSSLHQMLENSGLLRTTSSLAMLAKSLGHCS